MTNFTKNFGYLYHQSTCETDDEFGRKIGLSRWTVNKLLRGNREPTTRNLKNIAENCGVDPNDLYLGHKTFRKLYLSKSINSGYMVHALRTVKSNLHRCRDIFLKYSGQYIVYTNRPEKGIVGASLLDILRVTKNGIEFTMINPYREGSEHTAFEYKGYMMPIDEFLYFIGEQKENSYEILTMIFHLSGAPTSGLLLGLWSGIGVRDGMKSIASVPAVAVRRKKRIEDWRSVLNVDLGSIKAKTLPEMVQRRLNADVISVRLENY